MRMAGASSATTEALPAPTPRENTLKCSTHTAAMHDGMELFYRAWIPAGGYDRAVILFHRGHEHSARWEETVQGLAAPQTAYFAWDARGHGQSPGERGWAPSFATLVKDADTFARHICRAHDVAMEDVAVVAHSVGAVIAATWAHDYAPPIRGMVLATPAFDVKLYVPFAIPGLRLLNRIKKQAFVKSYVGGRLLTGDPEQAKGYDEDPLVSKQIAVNILLDLYDTSRRVVADAGAIRTPTLVLTAGADRVVKKSPQHAFYEGLGTHIKGIRSLEGSRHAVFHEKDRNRTFGHIRDFIDTLFENTPRNRSLMDADKTGYTKNEYDDLARPLPWLSPRRLWYAAQQFGMRTLGRLSEGVRIGIRTGFDSGESLDYVYENKARGITPLGRWIDAAYLKSIGWRGIRQRKVHLEDTLRRAIAEAGQDGDVVQVLDIATGGGRYLLETLKQESETPVAARLRDRSETALESARTNAKRLGLESSVTIEKGDAFDEESIASVSPPPRNRRRSRSRSPVGGSRRRTEEMSLSDYQRERMPPRGSGRPRSRSPRDRRSPPPNLRRRSPSPRRRSTTPPAYGRRGRHSPTQEEYDPDHPDLYSGGLASTVSVKQPGKPRYTAADRIRPEGHTFMRAMKDATKITIANPKAGAKRVLRSSPDVEIVQSKRSRDTTVVVEGRTSIRDRLGGRITVDR